MNVPNTTFVASAGTGKTYQVTNLYSALILGLPYPAEGNTIEGFETGGLVPGDECVDSHRVLMLTFARNAAAEMRSRITAQVEEQLGEADDPAFHWHVLRALSSAHISTIHSFAQRLLAENALAVGVSPSSRVMEADESEALYEEAIQQALSEHLAGARKDDPLVCLCRASGPGRVVERVVQLTSKLRSVGLTPADDNIGSLVAQAAAPSRDELVKLQLETAGVLCDEGNKTATNAIETLRTIIDDIPDGETADDVVTAATTAMASVKGAWGRGDDIKACRAAFKATLERITAWPLFVAAAEQTSAFLILCGTCMRSYRDRKLQAGLLDFDDLVLLAAELVEQRPELLPRFDVIIVDESQDNSRIQNALTLALARANTGASVILCGDIKQSIHTWRAADPTGMFKLAGSLDDVREVPLKVSYRSQKDLLEWINGIAGAAHVLGDRYEASDRLLPRPDALDTHGPNTEYLFPDWEYGGDLAEMAPDDVWKKGVPRRRFELTGRDLAKLADTGEQWAEWCDAYDLRQSMEARAVARRIKLLCSPEAPDKWRAPFMWDDASGTWVPRKGRTYKYRDVLILLRATTRQNIYEAALRELGIRYTTDGKGRGFYFRQEVFDVCSLLTWLAHPLDDAALLALARSPFIALSDSAIALLSARDGRLRAGGLRDAMGSAHAALEARVEGLLKAGLEEDVTVFRRGTGFLARLRSLRGRIAPVELVREAIRMTGYDAVLAGGFHGTQKLANLRKLLSLLQDVERRNSLTLQEAARWLREQVGATNAPDAPVADPEDDAVRISTVHAAKGLTAPVVLMPDLRRTPRRGHPPLILYDRTGNETGVAAKMTTAGLYDTTDIATVDREESERLETEREEQESKRLFYVAITRARDLLIMSGETPGQSGGAWRTWISQHMEQQLSDTAKVTGMQPYSYSEVGEGVAGLQEGDVDPLPAASASTITAAVDALPATTWREEYRLPVTTLVRVPLGGDETLTSEQLEFRRTGLVGLTAARYRHPSLPEAAEDADLPAPASAAALGTFGHAVLEHLDFTDSSDLDQQVATMLQSLGASGGERERLAGPLAAIAAHMHDSVSDADEIIRELPFSARFEADGASCIVDGKIDMIYRCGTTWHIVDYKFTQADERELLDHYALQLLLYRDAVSEPAGKTGMRRVQLDQRGEDASVELTLMGISKTGSITVVKVDDAALELPVADAVIRAARLLAIHRQGG